MRRSRWGTVGVGFAVGLLLACVDRQAELDEDLPTEEMPACLWVSGTGEWDDGRKHKLINEQGLASIVCACMTPETQWSFVFEDDPAFIEHPINDMALAECQRVSALYAFDWDPCQDYYESGEWRYSLGFDSSESQGPDLNREGLSCGEGDDTAELGCALGDREPAALGLLVLAGLFGLRRRSTAV